MKSLKLNNKAYLPEEVIWGAVIFLVGVLVPLAFSFFHIDMHHDGIVFSAAYDIYNGKTPYNEAFLQYGIGTTFIHYLSLNIFGPTLFSLRIITVLMYGLISLILFLIGIRLFDSVTKSIFITLFWSSTAYYLLPYHVYFIHSWSSVYALAMVLMALLTIIYTKTNMGLKISTGVFVGFSLLIKVNYGIISIFSILLGTFMLRVYHKRIIKRGYQHNLFEFIKGLSIVIFPVLALLLYTETYDSFIAQNVIYAWNFAVDPNGNSTILDSLIKFIRSLVSSNNGHGGVTYSNILLPFSNVLGLIYYIFFYKNSKDHAGVVWLLSFSVSMWLLYYPVPAAMHMYLANPLMYFGLFFMVFNHNNSTLRLIPVFLFAYIFVDEITKRSGAFEKLHYYYHNYNNVYADDLFDNIKISDDLYDHLYQFDQDIASLVDEDKAQCYVNYTNNSIYSMVMTYRHSVMASSFPGFHWGSVNESTNNQYYYELENCISSYRAVILTNYPYIIKDYYLYRYYNTVPNQDLAEPVYMYVRANSSIESDVAVAEKYIYKYNKKNYVHGSYKDYPLSKGLVPSYRLTISPGKNILKSGKIVSAFVEMLPNNDDLKDNSMTYKFMGEPVVHGFNTLVYHQGGMLNIYKDKYIVNNHDLDVSGLSINGLDDISFSFDVSEESSQSGVLRIQYDDLSYYEFNFASNE